jgi:hypothetical protein
VPAPRTVHDARDQEVLRANRELAAYFRGKRTEREARAALKIIKAFIRDRQHLSPDKRRPLPGMKAAPAPPRTPRKKTPSPKRARRSPAPVAAEPTESTVRTEP